MTYINKTEFKKIMEREILKLENFNMLAKEEYNCSFSVSILIQKEE